jgi:hypothetical protein
VRKEGREGGRSKGPEKTSLKKKIYPQWKIIFKVVP